MSVSLIAAVDKNDGIGYKGQLPWPYLKDDLKHFSKVTDGSIVIMGRKTWDSIPERSRPLEGRLNLVLTRDWNLLDLGMIGPEKPNYFAALESALTYAVQNAGLYGRNVFIIGGAILYKEALDLNLVTRMYITRVHGHFEADTFFPTYSTHNWERTYVDKTQATEKAPAYTFYEYTRKKVT